jgi:hypothetical protein
MIVGEFSVTVQFDEVGKDQPDIVHGKRAVYVTGNLYCLPAGQIGKNILSHLLDLLFQAGNLRLQINRFGRKLH